MMVRNDRTAERGTLLVEAIAMLGLIALVTPTLYKKSAERLQEIQDINIASQARTMNSIIDTFMKTNYSLLMQETSSAANNTVEIAYDDNTANYFELGYSSFVPFGYTPGDLKNYGAPKVYVHRDKDALVSYIVYPTLIDLGKKRAARVASLVGANGGTVSSPFGSGNSSNVEIFGTGGAWHLDHDMIEEMAFDNDSVIENSLVVTSNEPVTMSSMDSEKFLYRVPGEGHDYHNTMVTDLYMGGHHEETKWSGNANDYYSIFNLRKLMVNTNCTKAMAQSGHSGGGSSSSGVENLCDPNVADLYIGKPFLYDNKGTLDAMSPDHNALVNQGNSGAAWIYGNLSALNENFRLFRESAPGTEVFDLDRNPANYDVIEFVKKANESASSTASANLSIFRAENADVSRVTMMDDFVQAREAKHEDADSGTFEFLVGASSSVRGEGSFIHALTEGEYNVLRLNSPTDLGGADAANPPFETYINSKGGVVHINGGSSSDVKMETIINDMGGVLTAGKGGDWLIASGNDSSSEVHILRAPDFAAAGAGGDQRIFSVGKDDETDDANMIYGNVDRVSLRGGQVSVFNPNRVGTTYDGTNYGGETLVDQWFGSSNSVPGQLEGGTALMSRYTDILGSTYMGKGDMMAPESGDGVYSRSSFVLGVAGSAWVDRLLWAREAWFKKAGLQELHAGFENFADYLHNSSAAWLNAYDDSVIIRNRDKARDKAFTKEDSSSDTMFYADSSRVTLRDLEGASIELTDNTAYMGNDDNFFFIASASTGGYSSAAYMVGSTLANVYTKIDGREGVVNLQKDALKVKGQPGNAETYANAVEAKAGEFSIQTKGVEDGSANVQFYANDTDIRTRYVDFSVESDESSAIFKVMPNGQNNGSSDANVQVHGTFHVEGNHVMHVASNLDNRADRENGHDQHAMLEIDPEYVQVWGREQNSYSSFGQYAKNGDAYFAMLKINPSDISGSASAAGVTDDASIYVRRGAIEFEPSVSSNADAYAADEGFGYIKANRFITNTGKMVPTVDRPTGYEGGEAYDQYMVNPAYTSVMHDIKLTTRGGARLSDVLPDYVLKGVYNLVNNCRENQSEGDKCQEEDMSKWAHPYIGIVPYASCPPGYLNQATIIPISFNMGQGGDLILSNNLGRSGGTERTGRWVVNPFPRQAQIINKAGTNLDIVYPKLHEVSSYTYQEASGEHESFEMRTRARTEGWFWGYNAIHPTSEGSTTTSDVNTHGSHAGGGGIGANYEPWRYTQDDRGGSEESWPLVAEPLYFQQNTWLKTTISPRADKRGWDAYMGFLYDTESWQQAWGIEAPVLSNYNEGKGNGEDNPQDALAGSYVWNFFPVPTNTLEGHATVYCYFDRSKFSSGEWRELVDQIDQIGAVNDNSATLRQVGQKNVDAASSSYVERLNDPTLKYKDPW